MLVDVSSFNTSSFHFSFTTSSGDKIDLDMFDSVDIENSYKKTKNGDLEQISLRHQFGYEFHYKGNGLSEQDKKEIKEAFKKIKPLFEKFLNQKKQNDKIMTNAAHYIKSMLPDVKNENQLNFMKNEGVKSFDDVLKEMKAGFDELKKAKELFDKIFDGSKKLEIFA